MLRFRAEKGATYRLSGWMSGEKVPPEATCQIRLDFFSSPVPVHTSGRAFIEQEIDAYVAWGKREKVPLFLGEWGTIRFSFDEDRGGLRWVADMLDVLRARGLHAHVPLVSRGRVRHLPRQRRAARSGARQHALIELFTKKLRRSRCRAKRESAATFL